MHLWIVGIVGFLWSAMVLTTIHNFGFSNGFEVMGDAFSLIFTAIIFLASMGLWWYARAMGSQGTLT